MEPDQGQDPETSGVTPYTVHLHRKAEKTLYRLPKDTLRKVYQLITALETNPVPWRDWDIRRLEAHEETYRAHLGRYRLIYWVNWKAREVTVLKISSRGRAYKPT
jgi:mRNA interferase RelE/StbE